MPHASSPRFPARSAFWLGFALSGFFDGILLHQVLRWHHLLSGLGQGGGPFADPALQIAADGWFHALMYLVAAFALAFLWRGRAGLVAPGASPRLAGWLLIGFGVWHVADAGLSHWVLGLHRIRMDSETPLAWDVGWLLAFGAPPLAAGVLLLRRRGEGAAAARVLPLLVLATLGAGAWSAMPPAGAPAAHVIAFAPAVSFSQATRALRDAGVELTGLVSERTYTLRRRPTIAQAAALYARGALYVGGAGIGGGCSAWSAQPSSSTSQ
jgi:uncharacterized membrane protein